MNWKEILKPSREMIAIGAILFILFVPFIVYDNGIRCFRAPCPSSGMGSVLSWSMLSALHMIPGFIFSFDISIAVIGAIICYSLGCAFAPLLEQKRAKQKSKR